MFASLIKKVLGEKGGATYEEVNKMVKREKFSDYLPYIGYDAETNIYINIDNTVGYIWECSPVIFAGEGTENVLDGIFRMHLPRGSIVQFILVADDFLYPIVERFKQLKIRDNDITKITIENIAQWIYKSAKEGVKKNSSIPFRNFRLFVTVKVNIDEANEQMLVDIKKTIEELLKGAALWPHLCDITDLLHFLRRLFNENVDVATYGNYDDTIPIRKQVILDSYVKKTMDSLYIGSKLFKCITPKSFPVEVNSLQTNTLIGGYEGLISDSSQILSPFLLCVNIIYDNIKTLLHAKCNLVLNQQAVGSFAPSLQRKKEEYLRATDDIERGVPFVRIMPIFWVYDENHQRAIDSIKRVKRIWESNGYVMQEDRGILPIMFISSLPFGLYNIKNNINQIERDFIVQGNVANSVLPIQGDYKGNGEPQLIFQGRKGQICCVDIFSKEASNNNLFIAAGSGAGKSFLVNYIVANYFAANSLIRIIDIGYSYRKLVNIYGARYLDFNPELDICINPFSNIDEEDLDRYLSTICEIIIQMAFSNTNTSITSNSEIIHNIIKQAVFSTYQKYKQETNIDLIVEYLRRYPNVEGVDRSSKFIDVLTETAHMLAFNLVSFTSAGPYGKWFNGKSTFDISKDEMVVLELEGLKSQKDLFRVVTSIIINAVTQDLYLSDRSRKRLIIFDEAWQFLGGHEGATMQRIIEEGYRRARKYGGSFSVVTQSILDLKSFGPVGDVIRANSAFKFFLESSDFEKAKREHLIDYDDFRMQILKTIKSNKPNYSEIFMDTPMGCGVARLIVDEFTYYMFTSDASEVAKIEKIIKDKGVNYAQAINILLQENQENLSNT